MTRTRAVGVGVIAALVYIGGSIVGAHLTSMTRPMLDGLAPPPPYRWVNPPTELTASNQTPFSAHFVVDLTKDGSTATASSTKDGQVTIILSAGAIPPVPGQRAVNLDIAPVDPATLGALPSGLEPAGNTYQVKGTYQPGGRAITSLTGGGDQRVVLVYPAAASGAGRPTHKILESADGKSWQAAPTKDSPAQQQAEGTITALGYFVVATTGVPERDVGFVAVIILVVVLILLGGLVIARNIGVRRDGPNRASRR